MLDEDKAEMAADITLEIVHQYEDAMNNAHKMCKTYDDIMRKVPFGIVVGIYVAGKPLACQILGSGKEVKLALLKCAERAAMDTGEELSKDDIQDDKQ